MPTDPHLPQNAHHSYIPAGPVPVSVAQRFPQLHTTVTVASPGPVVQRWVGATNNPPVYGPHAHYPAPVYPHAAAVVTQYGGAPAPVLVPGSYAASQTMFGTGFRTQAPHQIYGHGVQAQPTHYHQGPGY